MQVECSHLEVNGFGLGRLFRISLFLLTKELNHFLFQQSLHLQGLNANQFLPKPKEILAAFSHVLPLNPNR